MPTTRSGAGTSADQNANNTNNTGNANPPPLPPPLTMEQLVAMQTQFMQGMALILEGASVVLLSQH